MIRNFTISENKSISEAEMDIISFATALGCRCEHDLQEHRLNGKGECAAMIDGDRDCSCEKFRRR